MFNSRFQTDASESPGFIFIRTYNLWYTQIQRALREVDLTLPQFITLTVIAYLHNHGEKPTQKMISDHSGIGPMTLSQILILLEKKKFIKRREHPDDSRAKYIVLLDTGQKKVDIALPIVESIDQVFFCVLNTNLPKFMESLQILSTENSN